MTLKGYFKHLWGSKKASGYNNSPRYFSTSRWLEGGQDTRMEVSITAVEKENEKNA